MNKNKDEKLLKDTLDKNLENIKYNFSSIFILENRLLTACEKIDEEITMKQWLLLAILENNGNDKTLTELGKIMGCSRQNVKKLAEALKDKGFLEYRKLKNNSINLIPTEKSREYYRKMNEKHYKILSILFKDFTDNEIEDLVNYNKKLFKGLELVEKYMEEEN